MSESSTFAGTVEEMHRFRKSSNEHQKHRATQEDGVVAVVVALVMIVLLLFVGLALDTSLARDRGSPKSVRAYLQLA